MQGILDLFVMIFDPPAVFARVRERPRFLAPFIGLAVLQMAIAFLMLPYTRAAMQAMARTAAGAGSASDPSRFAVIGVVFAPVGLAVGLVISAGILWVLVSLLAGEASFRHLLSVATYAGITGIFMGLAAYAVLALGGGRVETMADLRPAFGLDLLAPDAGRGLKTLLGMVNPFTLWGLVLTALGIKATHKISPGTAWAVAAIAFAVGSVIAAGFALVGGGRAG